jgi:hypothetical protein
MISFGQLLIAVSIPTVVAIVGILLNNSAVNSLRTEVRANITETRSLFNHFEERTKPKESN